MLKNEKVRLHSIKQAVEEELMLLSKLEKVRKRLKNLQIKNVYDISQEIKKTIKG